MKQAISLNSVHNSRELGGYPTADGKKVRDGVLLRTASLIGISDDDIRTLTDVYRLEHIIDFRMPMEMMEDKYPTISGAEYHHLDVIDQDSFIPQNAPDIDISTLDIKQMVEMSEMFNIQNEHMYIDFLSSDFGKKAYAEFFSILLDAGRDRAVLWHCTSGKDRTGLAAMLLLSAFGAEEELIVSDYLLTNEFNARKIIGTKQYMKSLGCDDALCEKAALMFDAVNETYLRNVLDFLKKEYGSVNGYIHDELNIYQDEIDSLKEKYLL